MLVDMAPERASPQLAPELLAEIARAVRDHATLERVVRWGLAQRPARLVVDVVKQDEFTHDVVIAFRDDIHLVYDST